MASTESFRRAFPLSMFPHARSAHRAPLVDGAPSCTYVSRTGNNETLAEGPRTPLGIVRMKSAIQKARMKGERAIVALEQRLHRLGDIFPRNGHGG